MIDPADVLFLGIAQTAVCWYRTVLPATFLEADWAGLWGEPPNLRFLAGQVKGTTQLPAFDSYKVVVIQQPRGRGWLKLIRGLQERGVKVVYEVDDYLHGIRKLEDHDYKSAYGKPELAQYELCMRVCDAMICSTEFIARRYRAYNKHVFVCENGLDLGRYQLTRPERATINIGWAGATAHAKAVQTWLPAVGQVMSEHPETTFVSIGMPFNQALEPHFPGRTIGVPWTIVDLYPGAMTLMDIALAPAGKSLFFRGKSDLRWLEAGALGIPLIADPTVYSKITPGVDGFHAETPQEVYQHLTDLVLDAELRISVGAAAKDYVIERRRMRVAVERWRDVIDEIGETATAIVD